MESLPGLWREGDRGLGTQAAMSSLRRITVSTERRRPEYPVAQPYQSPQLGWSPAWKVFALVVVCLAFIGIGGFLLPGPDQPVGQPVAKPKAKATSVEVAEV